VHRTPQGFITHPPASFDQLWRSGALPGLVTTLAKGAGCCSQGQSAAHGLPSMTELLLAVLLAPWSGQQEPWYAASAEKQQFVLFALARLGPHAGAMLTSAWNASGRRDKDALMAAAVKLAQPPLRQLLEAAAPTLLPLADPLADAVLSSRHQPADETIVRRAMGLLVALGEQLDPLALGLALPGCWNPGCTSLAGASEADMKLKRCKGCRVAR
jgi:hypothetical protein